MRVCYVLVDVCVAWSVLGLAVGFDFLVQTCEGACVRKGVCVFLGCLCSLLGAWTCNRFWFIGSDFVSVLVFRRVLVFLLGACVPCWVFVDLVGCLDWQSVLNYNESIND